jgi:hypothetical protein
VLSIQDVKYEVWLDEVNAPIIESDDKKWRDNGAAELKLCTPCTQYMMMVLLEYSTVQSSLFLENSKN